MPRNVRYAYNYACGANCYIKINGVTVLEGVSIQWNLRQNKLPLYGYYSAEFSAIADGQVLVQGELLVNHINSEYVYELMRKSVTTTPTVDTSINDNEADKITNVTDAADSKERDDALISYYWNNSETLSTSEYNSNIFGKGLFGRPDQYNKTFAVDIYINNKLSYRLNNVSFVGRAQSIVIDDQPLLEAFPFLAQSVL
jgi:hypothetical protein